MWTKRTLRTGILMLGIAMVLPLEAQQRAGVPSPAPSAPRPPVSAQVDAAYDTATVALDRGDYARAIDLFTDIANQKGDRADAALYWVAYAQQRQGDGGGAINTIGVLRREFPESAWLDDADHLVAEIRGARGDVRDAPRAGRSVGRGRSQRAPRADEDAAEDMRVYALNALMHVDAERAVPLLERMIRSDEDIEIRKRALFVLMQGHADEALPLIAEVVRNDSDPEMRIYAMRHLGMFGGAETMALMEEIYREATDVEVKEAIIAGYMMGGSTERLYEIAKNEPVHELRVAAIRHLAMVGGADELWELYEGEGSVEVREAILQTVFMAGDHARLLQVARTESDIRLRRAAIRALGMMGGGHGDGESDGETVDMSAALLELYRANEDMEIREAILNAFWMRGDTSTLIALYEETDDQELQRRIVQALSMTDDEEAIDFLIRIIEQ